MDLPEVAGKQLEFLREIVPKLGRVGVLRDDRIGAPQLDESKPRPARSTSSSRPVSGHPIIPTCGH
jgi:hypothetical protein